MEETAGEELREQGGLKKLVLHWFTETQAQRLQSHGNYPDWFQGFAGRKEAEHLLRDKPLGCFLVRLSDKAVGFILSYRGVDRCRHFVITQNPAGQFVISGDCLTYGSLTELIDHYRLHPIQPFGEQLTCSCHQEGQVYDVVNYETRKMSGVSVQALRDLWDQGSPRHSATNRTQLPPALPSKSQSWRLSVSPSPAERDVSPGFALHDAATGTTPPPGEAQSSSTSGYCPAGGTEQSEGRPLQAHPLQQEEEEEEEEDHLSAISSLSYPPTPLKVTCHTYSLHAPGAQSASSSWSEQLQAPKGPTESSAGWRDVLYAEVAERPTPTGQPDRTYEHIDCDSHAHHSLDDTKTKKSKFTWGKKSATWKKLLPEHKKN